MSVEGSGSEEGVAWWCSGDGVKISTKPKVSIQRQSRRLAQGGSDFMHRTFHPYYAQVRMPVEIIRRRHHKKTRHRVWTFWLFL